ncbi:MAG: DUF1819 family protein [bacterium]|nr:DUF1819 family protein [bacterium]MCY3889188.1 DUF1819 family protein [bacterium]
MSGGLTSRLLKGGAVLEDTHRVVELWDAELSAEANIERLAAENLLGKSSRSRLNDLLYSVIRPRYVEPGTHVIPALQALVSDQRAFREACYYETSRADNLLAAFAEGPLWGWWCEGRLAIAVDDVLMWLRQLMDDGTVPSWSESVRGRAARGLLSTLRDFGILKGVPKGHRKELISPSLSPRGFAYVAWREHEQGASSRALANSAVWHRWLLEDALVDDLFVQAARLGVLRVSRAGSAVRVDWLVGSLAEVTGAAA